MKGGAIMIKEKLQLLPHLPGCYLMKNNKGTINMLEKQRI